MPTYEYKCTNPNCGCCTEALQKITDAPLVHCEKCGQNTLKRGPGGGIGLSFNGSGFYKNDYGSGSKGDAPPEAPKGCCPCGKNKGSCSSQ